MVKLIILIKSNRLLAKVVINEYLYFKTKYYIQHIIILKLTKLKYLPNNNMFIKPLNKIPPFAAKQVRNDV